MADDLGLFFSEIQEVEASVQTADAGAVHERATPPRIFAQSVVAKPAVTASAAQVIAAAAPALVPLQEHAGEATTSKLSVFATSQSDGHVSTVGAVHPIMKQDKKFIRTGANEVWVDETLSEWPENDFRLFIGDLGNEVTTEMLAKEFQGKYSSFAKAKVGVMI